MSRKFLLLFSVLLMVWVQTVTAQDATPEATPSSPQERYDGIPTSRAEDGGFVLGSPDAPLTIVEFADFLCSHCQDYQETAHAFIAAYVATGQAKFEYRMFPIIDPTYSPYLSQLAECTDEQREGAFWPAHDILYALARDGQIGPDVAEILAAELELDTAALETCAETADQHETDSALGERVGINGTPATRIRVGDGEVGYIQLDGDTFSRGGLPIDFLTRIVETEDMESLVFFPTPLLGGVVTGEPCAAPCWNAIIPGETAWANAVGIVQNAPETVRFQEFDADEATDRVGLQWEAVNSSQPSLIVSSEDGSLVDVIVIQSTEELTIGDLFGAQGEPASARAQQDQQGYVFINLIYPEISTVVVALADQDAGGAAVLTDASSVLAVQFFSPSFLEENLAQSPGVEWTGLDALETYFPSAAIQP